MKKWHAIPIMEVPNSKRSKKQNVVGITTFWNLNIVRTRPSASKTLVLGHGQPSSEGIPRI